MRESPHIDRIDEQILDILVANSRTSYREIAKRVKLSAPATIERIAKMQDSGLIKGFTISLNRETLGLPIQAFMRTATEAGGGPRLLERIAASPEVEECHKVTGNDSYILKISVASMLALEALIERFAEVGTVNTSLILSSPIPYRTPHRPRQHDDLGGR